MYIISNITNIIPSFLFISSLLLANEDAKIVTPVITIISVIILGSIGIGIIALLIPKINKILNIHEPTTFPIGFNPD